MKIIHRIFENCIGKDEFKKDLDEIGFSYHYEESVVGRFLGFEISQSNAQWGAVSAIMHRHNIEAINFRTEFNKSELLEAEYLEMVADGHFGYPQPENGYTSIIYNGSDGCSNCGVGYVQQSPFRIKGEPKWGRRGFLQLNWVFDEYFVRPEIWHDVFEPFGIKCRPVLWYKKESVLDTVMQLDIDNTATSPLQTEGLVVKPCHICERKKYGYPIYGPYPTFKIPQTFNLLKTQEYFGDAHKADRLVIVSQEMYRWILKKKIRGVSFVPMVDDPGEYVRTHLE